MMGFLLLIARLLFSAVFIISGIGHLTNTRQMSMYAESKSVPFPKLAVVVSGIFILFGGFSVLLGLWVKVGALLLIAFLFPAAVIMHNFWNVADPADRQNEQIHFTKDLALAGGAFFIWFLYVTVEHVPWSIG